MSSSTTNPRLVVKNTFIEFKSDDEDTADAPSMPLTLFRSSSDPGPGSAIVLDHAAPSGSSGSGSGKDNRERGASESDSSGALSSSPPRRMPEEPANAVKAWADVTEEEHRDKVELNLEDALPQGEFQDGGFSCPDYPQAEGGRSNRVMPGYTPVFYIMGAAEYGGHSEMSQSFLQDGFMKTCAAAPQAYGGELFEHLRNEADEARTLGYGKMAMGSFAQEGGGHDGFAPQGCRGGGGFVPQGRGSGGYASTGRGGSGFAPQGRRGGFGRWGRDGGFATQGRGGCFAAQRRGGGAAFAPQGRGGDNMPQGRGGSSAFAPRERGGRHVPQGRGGGACAAQGHRGGYASQGGDGASAPQASGDGFAPQVRGGGYVQKGHGGAGYASREPVCVNCSGSGLQLDSECPVCGGGTHKLLDDDASKEDMPKLDGGDESSESEGSDDEYQGKGLKKDRVYLTDEEAEEIEATTVMLRMIPTKYRFEHCKRMFDRFNLEYDFFYQPFHFGRKRPLGYIIINFASHQEAVWCKQTLDGFRDWECKSRKVAQFVWGAPHTQGYSANVNRYRSSPVMHESVDPIMKPRVVRDGKPCVLAPLPGTTVRAPRGKKP